MQSVNGNVAMLQKLLQVFRLIVISGCRYHVIPFCVGTWTNNSLKTPIFAKK